MNKQTKEDLIKNCGKLPVQARGPNGVMVISFTGRCNYYKDCEICNGYEARKRHKKYESILRKTDNLFIAIVDGTDKGRLSKKLHREGANSLCVPQPDGTLLYISNINPNHKDIPFTSVHKQDVLSELNKHHNLFPEKRRSTIGEWSLSDSDPEPTETNEVVYQDMICYFSPINSSTSENMSKVDFMRGAAMVWDGGEVTIENVQHSADMSVSALIESMRRSGWGLVPEKTKIVSRKVTAEELKNWHVINIDTSKDAISYPNAPKDEVRNEFPELVQIMDANTGIKNWRLWLINERKQKLEERKNKKNAKTFSDYGLDVDMVLGVDEAN